MRKSILYTIIAICFYYLSAYSLALPLRIETIGDFFFNIDESYLLIYELFVYLFLITIALIFIKIYGVGRYPITDRKITIQSIIQVVIIAILIRIIEDPILKINMIMGERFPVINTNETTPLLELIIMIFVIVLFGPIYEELLFRRIILNFYDKKNITVGIVLSSIFFAFMHFNLSFTNYTSVFPIFIFGLIACLIYIRKGLFYSILFHISYNILWLIINENKKQYWSILQKLDFGVWYWIIVIVSLSLFLYIGMIKLKLFMKETANTNL
jgi:membrane protease YdiL (CAAX protease family)